jgi:hypothetical protein
MYEQTTNYFAATLYACEVLGADAPKHFARLHQLSKYNDLEELKSIIDGWCPKDSRPAPKAPPAGAWAAGSQWGSATRVARDRGIIWKLKCQCGKNFELSTNDTTPEHLRKCPTCIFADELSETKKQFVSRLDETSKIVLEWHRAHDKLIWNRVHKACAKRGITSDWTGMQFKKELHALCWAKIAEKVCQYQDKGFKVSAWLGRVADNAIKDYFKLQYVAKRDVRKEVALLAEDCRDAVAPPTRQEEVLPAKSVRPKGVSPHNEDTKASRWDEATGKTWAT